MDFVYDLCCRITEALLTWSRARWNSLLCSFAVGDLQEAEHEHCAENVAEESEMDDNSMRCHRGKARFVVAPSGDE